MTTRRIIDHADKFVALGLSRADAFDLAVTKLGASLGSVSLARTIWERM